MIMKLIIYFTAVVSVIPLQGEILLKEIEPDTMQFSETCLCSDIRLTKAVKSLLS